MLSYDVEAVTSTKKDFESQTYVQVNVEDMVCKAEWLYDCDKDDFEAKPGPWLTNNHDASKSEDETNSDDESDMDLSLIHI